MRTIILCLAALAVAFGADTKTEDKWAKVKELKTGSDLRVYKLGGAKPVEAKLGDVTEDNLIVVMKNEQMAIAKKDIARVEYHPPASKPAKTEKQAISTDGYGVNREYSSGASWGREGWQMVYQK
jgi:hypothetical protein